MAADLEPLQVALGHRFTHPELLERALVHRSYLEERPGLESNETLEFLGDAVLQLAVTDYLLRAHVHLPEGQLTKVRAAVVSEAVLAEVALQVGVGPALHMGRAEAATGGRDKPSILADAMEALLGGIYLDGGFEAARQVVERHWTGRMDAKAEAPGRGDYKGRLQELLAQAGEEPTYSTTGEGPDHRPLFTAVVSVGERELGRGTGTSKKRAEQDAARQAIEQATG